MRIRPLVAALFVATIVIAPRVFAQPLAGAPPDPAEAVLARVAAARGALAHASVGTSRIGGDHAVLAVGRIDGGPITLVHVRYGRSRTHGFKVALRRRNGVNSRYEVLEPEGLAVLAIKTNVHARLGMSRHRRSMPAIYVPYGPELRTPTMERRGLGLLRSEIRAARARLDRAGVRAQRDPDVPLTAGIPDRMLLSILLIEHMEPSEFHAEGAAAPMGKVLTTLALNGADSYRYSVSSAHAGGLAQFIRRTYDATRARYPGAGLPRDFVSAMQDHETAIVAQFCLIDWILSRLPDAQRALLPTDEDIGAYVAASYNGGEDRALDALTAHPRSWELRGRGLARQTVGYVAEFRAVHRLLLPDS